MERKIYCLTPNGGDFEDMGMTFSYEKALEWLQVNPEMRTLMEYTVTPSGISKSWSSLIWYDGYGNLKTVKYD
jgi:hypothetical protein